MSDINDPDAKIQNETLRKIVGRGVLSVLFGAAAFGAAAIFTDLNLVGELLTGLFATVASGSLMGALSLRGASSKAESDEKADKAKGDASVLGWTAAASTLMTAAFVAAGLDLDILDNFDDLLEPVLENS